MVEHLTDVLFGEKVYALTRRPVFEFDFDLMEEDQVLGCYHYEVLENGESLLCFDKVPVPDFSTELPALNWKSYLFNRAYVRHGLEHVEFDERLALIKAGMQEDYAPMGCLCLISRQTLLRVLPQNDLSESHWMVQLMSIASEKTGLIVGMTKMPQDGSYRFYFLRNGTLSDYLPQEFLPTLQQQIIQHVESHNQKDWPELNATGIWNRIKDLTVKELSALTNYQSESTKSLRAVVFESGKRLSLDLATVWTLDLALPHHVKYALRLALFGMPLPLIVSRQE